MSVHYFTAIVVKIRVLSQKKSSPKRQILSMVPTSQLSHIIYTGWSCSFLTSAAIMGVQMGEISKLGWLIGWSTRDTWADSFYFLYAVFSSIRKTFASLQHTLWFLRTHVGLFLIFQADPVSGYICTPYCVLLKACLFRRCNICHNHMGYCTHTASSAGHL
jgi:hypothetical protein